MPQLQTQVDLQPHNTLAIPARSAYYATLTDPKDLPELLAFARERQLPLLLLGGGSNLVLREDFPGLVLHVQLQGRELVKEDQDHAWLKVAAGENWHQLVLHSLTMGYSGLENLSLIPGSVGAAPIQNIGAYGVELKDVFEELEAVELSSGETHHFTKNDCQFAYRDSIFKHELKDRYLITSVTLRLRKKADLQLGYPALQQALAGTPSEQLTPIAVSQAVCQVRQSKLPDPAQTPNAGSFFKNPIVPHDHWHQLQTQYPKLVAYPIDGQQVKLAAGWLIEQAGWKGAQRGPVAVHDKQALVLTNPGRAMGKELLALAGEIQESVWEKFGVRLEVEPRLYP